MDGLYSCIIAISMYSKFPMPTVEWTQKRMGHVMCFFPVVGILEGAVMGLWLYAGLGVLDLALPVTALVAAAIPILVTGGIHMDGFVDTMDAIHSYGSREKKLEIMKDPHVGAFAVISLAVYMLIYVAVIYEYVVLLSAAGKSDRLFLCGMPAMIFVMERAFSGLSVVTFPAAKQDGLAAGFARAARKRTERLILVLWLALCAIIGLTCSILGSRRVNYGTDVWRTAGAGCLAVTLLLVFLVIFIWYYRRSKKEFGGVTGDLAGCFLQICEVSGFAAMVILLKSGAIGGM